MKPSDNPISAKEAFHLYRRAVLLLFRCSKRAIIAPLCLAAWTGLTPYVTIWLSARLIDELALGKNSEKIYQLALAALLSAALISLVTALLTRCKEMEAPGVYYRIEQIYLQKMMSLDFADADNARIHELYHRIQMNENSAGWGLLRIHDHLEDLVSALCTTVGGIALTASLFTLPVPAGHGNALYDRLNSPWFLLLFGLVLILLTGVAPYIYTMVDGFIAKFSQNQNQGNLFFGFFGDLGNRPELAADVRIYRQEDFCDPYLLDKTHIFFSKGLFAKWKKTVQGPSHSASAALSALLTGSVYLFVCLKALGGAFGIGSITRYVASITRLTSGVSTLLQTLGSIRNNAPFLELIFQFLDIPNKMYQGSLTVEKRSDCNYEIEFQDVSFRYPGSETYALRHVKLKFQIGKRLAVVGENGSGKTTFIKLLCRLYDPTEGRILLNGIDIRKYDYREYLSIFSVVFQDFQLLAFPLGQNVAANAFYDRKKVEDCLIQAGFCEKLARWPKGTETWLYKALDKGGVDISGGEAQKIALARSLYKDAPFIILDEPTAALDPIAEAEVYEKFNELVDKKTAVYISHRLSSCRFCDRIAVFHEGAVVQTGTHEELVACKGSKYQELWNAQAQYYDRSSNGSETACGCCAEG